MEEKEKKIVSLKIDGIEVKVPEETTILEAADSAGIYIPRLCHDKRLKPFGACRLCLVEIEGRGAKLLTACSTPVENGISVITHNERIDKARKTVMELLAVHHPIDCPICDAAGECQMQILTDEIRGIEKRRFSGKEKNYVRDSRNPLIERNMNRCVGCGKCARICSEVQGTFAISFQYRGFSSTIGTPFGEPLQCDFCGQCIDICPVGALQNKQYKFTTRSWLLSKHKTVCPYCGDGCILEAGVGTKGTIVRGKSAEGTGINRQNLCQRGRFGHDFILSPLRLSQPMIRKGQQIVTASWDEAIESASLKLNKINETNRGKEIAYLIGSRIDNEALTAISRFVNSFSPDSTITSSALGKLTDWIEVSLKVWGINPPFMGADRPLHSDLIIVIESEINATNPLTWTNIYAASTKNDSKLIVIDSRRTKVGRRAQKFLRISPGGGTEFLMRIAGYLTKKAGNISNNVMAAENFSKFAREVSALTPSATNEIKDTQIEWIANELIKAKDPLIVITLDASENMKSKQLLSVAANLIALIGKEPQNILVPLPEANMRGLIDVLNAISGKIENPLELIQKIIDGKVKALYCIGDDPLSRLPDTESTRKALESLDLLIVQDIVMSPTAARADIILPASAWSEHEGSYTSSGGLIQVFGKIVSAPGNCLTDREIIIRLGEALGINMKGLGCEEARNAFVEKFARNSPVLIPEISKYDTDLELMNLKEKLPVKKLAFAEVGYPLTPPQTKNNELILVTGVMRGHNGTLSTYSQAITSVFPEPNIFLNPLDATAIGVNDGDSVNIRTSTGEISLKVKIDEEVKKGVAFVPAHFSEPPVLGLISSESYLSGMATICKITPLRIYSAMQPGATA